MSDRSETPPPRRSKAPHDTAGGCRDRATADLALAATMDTSNRRVRLEHSAAAWAQRADMIQRLDESFEARRTAASLMWAEEETAGRRVGRAQPLGGGA